MNEADDRWHVIDRIFSEALDLAPEARNDFVRGRCGDDSDLRRRVFDLLAAARDHSFLDDREDQDTIESVLAEAVGSAKGSAGTGDPLLDTELGPYRIIRVLGHGGMGSVYLGERTTGFEQRVAIKTLRRGIDTDEVVARFLTERQILAQLDHPNIARLFDGGVTLDGRPYFVMEFVQGQYVTDYADELRLGIPERLRLLDTVASALQHAHQHLVIHRDLKPSNVLVTADGVVKLLDFGIARLIGSDRRESSLRTATTFRMFTPEYAAPEQVAREAVTTATDVYQFGALTYELLSGARPFSVDLTGLALEREVLGVEPEPLSRAVARAGDAAHWARGYASRHGLRKALEGDLGVIVGKALAKEPERRYGSIEAMARDFDRHLTGHPIAARPATVGYRLGRFAKRNRWFVPVAATTVIALAAYVGTSTVHNRELTVERNRAQAEAERAEAVTEFLAGVFASSNPWDADAPADLTVLEVLDNATERVEQEFAGQPLLQARVWEAIGASYYGLNRLDAAEAVQRRALELRVSFEGTGSPGAIEGAALLARTLASRQKSSEALEVLEPVVPLVGALPTEERPRLEAIVMAELAWARWGVSDFDSAFVLYERADSVFSSMSRPDPTLHGHALRQYSVALRQADASPERQLAVAARAVGLLEQALPNDHVELAAARGDLAGALSAAGRREEALQQYDQIIPVFEQRLESNDPNVLAVLSNRALLLMAVDRYEEAATDLRRVEELYRTHAEPKPRLRATNLQNLAAALKGLGRVDEAIRYSLDAHELYSQSPDSGFRLAFPLLTLAEMELDRKNFTAALDYSSRAFDILSTTLPEGHYATSVARCRRGRSLWALGDRPTGLADLRAAGQALEASSLDRDHEYVVECRNALSEALGGRS